VTYVASGPEAGLIDYLTDTLGRVLDFHWTLPGTCQRV
jgi:hypothetical protein